MALVSAEAWWAETAGTQVSRHAGSAVTTAQGATGLGVIFAGGARVTRLTLADVSVFGVARYSTRSSIFAWCVLATVEHSFTALAGVSCTAFAAEIVDKLYAVVGSIGVTGVRQALVDVALAALANKPSRTHAAVTSHAVNTAAAVKTARLAG